jgi:hypothetical protein
MDQGHDRAGLSVKRGMVTAGNGKQLDMGKGIGEDLGVGKGYILVVGAMDDERGDGNVGEGRGVDMGELGEVVFVAGFAAKVLGTGAEHVGHGLTGGEQAGEGEREIDEGIGDDQVVDERGVEAFPEGEMRFAGNEVDGLDNGADHHEVAAAVGMTEGELERGGSAAGEADDTGCRDIEFIEQGGVEIGLRLGCGATGEGSMQIAGSRGRDEHAVVRGEEAGETKSLVIAAGRAMGVDNGRALSGELVLDGPEGGMGTTAGRVEVGSESMLPGVVGAGTGQGGTGERGHTNKGGGRYEW